MHVLFACPRCSKSNDVTPAAGDSSLACACGWHRDVKVSAETPQECLVCGCGDLWRQKDFPQKLGLFLVALGALLSTIAWWQHQPVWALGILLAFAAADLTLFIVLKDVLVCYRCGSRYRDAVKGGEGQPFNLETAERYRQEAARLSEMSASAAGSHPPSGTR